MLSCSFHLVELDLLETWMTFLFCLFFGYGSCYRQFTCLCFWSLFVPWTSFFFIFFICTFFFFFLFVFFLVLLPFFFSLFHPPYHNLQLIDNCWMIPFHSLSHISVGWLFPPTAAHKLLLANSSPLMIASSTFPHTCTGTYSPARSLFMPFIIYHTEIKPVSGQNNWVFTPVTGVGASICKAWLFQLHCSYCKWLARRKITR